jgi:hypothetical protein
LNRLPSLTELSDLSTRHTGSLQLGELAHQVFVDYTNLKGHSLTDQVGLVVEKVWGVTAVTPELIGLGVNHLAAGGSWGDVWLALVHDPRFSGALRDAQGGQTLVGDGTLGETGWSLSSGDDSLSGGADQDVLVGGSGNNTLDGGAGTDLAVFFGSATDMEVALVRQASGVHEAQLRHKTTGDLNTVRDVEYFQFGANTYRVPVGQPQPADGVFVALTAYLEPVPKNSLVGVGLHSDWIA